MVKREREYRRHGEGWEGRCCEVCGSRADIQYHHRKPHAQGGDDSDKNLQPLCPECHAKQDGQGHRLVKHMSRGDVGFGTVLEQRQYEESRAPGELICETCGKTISAGDFIYVGGGNLEVCRCCLGEIQYQYQAAEVKARKSHVCGLCGRRAIRKGQSYFYVSQRLRCCGACVDAEYRRMHEEEMRHWFGDDYAAGKQ